MTQNSYFWKNLKSYNLDSDGLFESNDISKTKTRRDKKYAIFK
jgi:hypothetical protein